MSGRIAAPLAWSVWALSVSFAALGLFFVYLNDSFENLLDESLGVDAVLALVYFGSVATLQYALRTLTGGGSQLVIVASTLAIAALFGPLRRRIQALIDRRFYRRKYDAAKTLETFSVRLRDAADPGRLKAELLTVVRETVQPERVSLWMRPAGDGAGGADERAGRLAGGMGLVRADRWLGRPRDRASGAQKGGAGYKRISGYGFRNALRNGAETAGL